MIRRASHIILSVFLLLASTGVSFSMHYCGDKLVSAKINTATTPCCDGTGGCCENRTFQFHTDDDAYVCPVVTETQPVSELQILFPIQAIESADLYTFSSTKKKSFSDTSPPQTAKAKVALLQSYRC